MSTAAGVVAATRREAVEAGEEVLREGGTAVDAAVAASMVLGVVEPYMTGPGAVGEMLYMDPAGRCYAADMAARAPFGATSTMFRIVGPPTGLYYPWPEVEGSTNSIGARSVAAPRLIGGLDAMHRRFGRLPWKRLVSPAIRLAAVGFEVDYFSAAVFAHEMRTLKTDPEARALYYRHGVPLPPPIDTAPATMTNAGLAEALRAVADSGPDALVEGKIAVATLREVADRGGILSRADLAAAAVSPILDDIKPLTRFRDFQIYASPLPSGGVTAAQILGLLDRLPPLGTSALAPARYERFALVSTRAFADRLSHMSGADGERHVHELLSDERLDAAATALGARSIPRPAGAGHHSSTATTCLTVADSKGGLVSITQTLLSFFGSQVGVRGYGFHLNNGMLWFDPTPGSPNSIESGKRALAAVTPLIAVSPDGSRRVAFAGLGARRIISAVAQAVENYVEYHMPLDRAINAPRIHSDTGDTLVDERLPATVSSALRRLGLDPKPAPYGPTSTGIARLTAAEYDSRSGATTAAIDLRARATWQFGR